MGALASLLIRASTYLMLLSLLGNTALTPAVPGAGPSMMTVRGHSVTSVGAPALVATSSSPAPQRVLPQAGNSTRVQHATAASNAAPVVDHTLLSLKKPVVASSTNPYFPAVNVTDGSLATIWSVDSYPNPTFAANPSIEIDLGKIYQVRNVHITSGGTDANGCLNILNYSVNVSTDHTAYSAVATSSNLNYPPEGDTFSAPARYIKVVVDPAGGTCGVSTYESVEIKEISVYGILSLPDDQNGPRDQSCNCSQPSDGGPFNTRTGFLWTAATDIRVDSPGTAITWERTYNSRSINEVTGPLGYGWQHPYNARLILPTDPGGETGNVVNRRP